MPCAAVEAKLLVADHKLVAVVERRTIDDALVVEERAVAALADLRQSSRRRRAGSAAWRRLTAGMSSGTSQSALRPMTAWSPSSSNRAPGTNPLNKLQECHDDIDRPIELKRLRQPRSGGTRTARPRQLRFDRIHAERWEKQTAILGAVSAGRQQFGNCTDAGNRNVHHRSSVFGRYGLSSRRAAATRSISNCPSAATGAMK